jgi:hypothetical protein
MFRGYTSYRQQLQMIWVSRGEKRKKGDRRGLQEEVVVVVVEGARCKRQVDW